MAVNGNHIQLFILFQECISTHFYTKLKEDLIDEKEIYSFFQDLDIALECIQKENYKGFYDADNIKAFLSNYNTLDDYYPISPRKKLQQSLRGWINWKTERESEPTEEYKIKKTPSNDNSFGEVHARRTKFPGNKYLIVSLDAICFQNQLVDVEKTSNASVKQIECIELKKELKKWFDINRTPPRKYNANPKHGENGRGEWRHEASKLLCSHKEAEDMLSKAIGISGIDELYYYDKNNNAYIIFRYEGNIPQNQFHAYHLSSKDNIDKDIKRILDSLS